MKPKQTTSKNNTNINTNNGDAAQISRGMAKIENYKLREPLYNRRIDRFIKVNGKQIF